MLKQLFAFTLISLNLIGAPAAFAAKAFPPAPINYIYDESQLLSSEDTREISSYLREQDQQTGNQVLVAIFKSTEDEDFVDYTNRLFKVWNPGQKGKDNGVILALFIQERKSRIEVGYGLEPVLTDAISKRIMITVLKPYLQQDQYGQGVYQTVKAIQAVIHDPKTAEEMTRPQKGSPLPSWLMIVLFGGIFGFLYLFDRFGSATTLSSGRNIRRRGPWDGGFGGGGFGGGGGWGGGSGGGGFSGGGGSSGGGGASGSW